MGIRQTVWLALFVLVFSFFFFPFSQSACPSPHERSPNDSNSSFLLSYVFEELLCMVSGLHLKVEENLQHCTIATSVN